MSAVAHRMGGRMRKIEKSLDEIHTFWRNPPPTEGNNPDDYAKVQGRSENVVEFYRARLAPDAPILEFGCNVGRNLNALRVAGARNLAGVEISAVAVERMAVHFPELHATARIMVGPGEEIFPKLQDSEFDLVFTMAVLLHVHPDSESLFAEIARVTGRYLVTIENETWNNNRIFSRNYLELFTGLGMRQIETRQPQGPGLAHYVMRVFEKAPK